MASTWKMNIRKSDTVVARKLVAALVPHFPASGVMTPGMNIEYVLNPQILHWEIVRRNAPLNLIG